MKAVIYARYSSHSQTEQSIEGQLHDNHAWAKQQGITVIAEYIDRALTGTKDARPDFQRMIADAAKRQFELVIVWKLDRFARNRYDSAIYKARLKKYGVKVVSVKENISDSPEGIILEGMLESMAEYYSANLSQNIKRGKRESMLKGLFSGGPVPYGYKVSAEKKLIIDEKTAPAIRYMFEQYAAGVSKKEIIDELNRRGYRNEHGKPYAVSAFQRALSNPVYTGNFRYKGEVIPDLAERMIDDETFAKVQDRLKRTARAPAAAKAKVNYLLQGKAYCGHCGAPMVGESGRSHTGATYNYYACAEKKKHHSCHKKNERKDELERYIVQQTMDYILTPRRSARVAKAVVTEYKAEFSDTRISDCEKAIQQLDREMDKLVDALIDSPPAARKKINERIEALDAQKSELDVELSQLRIAHGIEITEQEVRSWLNTFCNGDINDEDFRRRIIDVFIGSVYIYDDRIIVFYNIRGGKQVTYTDLQNSSVPTGSKSSDLNAYAPLNDSKFEPLFVFVNGVFGCIFPSQ